MKEWESNKSASSERVVWWKFKLWDEKISQGCPVKLLNNVEKCICCQPWRIGIIAWWMVSWTYNSCQSKWTNLSIKSKEIFGDSWWPDRFSTVAICHRRTNLPCYQEKGQKRWCNLRLAIIHSSTITPWLVIRKSLPHICAELVVLGCECSHGTVVIKIRNHTTPFSYVVHLNRTSQRFKNCGFILKILSGILCDFISSRFLMTKGKITENLT